MDYQDSTARSHRSQRKPTDGGQGGNVGAPDSRSGSWQQQGPMTSGDSTGRINQELRWEKVPVVHSGSNNNTIRVITSGRFNGPRPDRNPCQGSPTEALFHAMNHPFQDQHFWPHHSQGYFQQSQPAPYHPRVVKVPMLIETMPAPQSPVKAISPLPVMPAKVSHNFEIVRASLVHPGTPLGPYSSQTFTVDESELGDFDPFKKQESILKSLDLDVTRLRRGHSTPDNIVMKETSFGPESSSNDLNNNNDDDDDEIIINSAPQTEHFNQQHQQDHHHHHHRPQHPLSPSKSSAGDLKSGPLFRKPSIRRKSNPLAAFLQGGSKEVKKSSKSKAPSSAALPSGLKIRERGCSLTRCPTDSKTRLDQLMGNPPKAKNADPLSDAWTDYIENTYEKFETVLRKEQEGYGIQLHGQYPVVVDNVRPGGGAGKGGIVKGDIIFKINGKLVIKQNHEYVIECFNNPFMSITVLRAPQTGEPKQNNLTTLFGQGDKISNPSPAARDKNLELEKNTLATLRSMHEQAVGELEQLKTEAQRNSDDLMMMKYEKQAKLINQLEKRISQMELSSGQPGMPSSPAQDASAVIGLSNATVNLPKLSMPGEPSFGPSSTGNQTQAPNILSMEGLDNPVEEEGETLIQHKEFEDLNLLRQSPPHLACFLKYLVQSSNPNYMLFHIVANSYVQSSLKETSQSARWAFEIYLAFLLETSPLPLRLHPNIVKFVESCLSSGKDIKSIFHSALSSVQEQIVKQLEEFQHQRTLGLGNFFGEELLPKPKSNLSTSSSFTAPVTYNTSHRPPLSHSNLSLTSSPSMTSVNSTAASSRGTSNLSSSSFSHTKSSSIGNGSDVFVVEKILWEVFESCLTREEENSWKPEETRPAIAAALATFFRHQGIPLSNRQNQLTLDSIPSFVWRDKKALKSKLKLHVTVNSHYFVPHLCSVMTVVECSLCSNVLWGAGYQGHRCQCCDMVFHNSCMRLPSVPQCSKVPSKLRSGREEHSSTFYAPDPSSFHSLPLRRKKKGLDEGPILSDSENTIMSELDLVGSPTGSMTPLITGHGSGPSLTHLSSYEINDSDMEVEQDLPPLSKVIPEDALSQLVGVARKKQEIINELFYTERSHVKSLLITVHHYLKPMRNDPKIDQQLVDLLFPNLESITQWHKELSADFKARRKEQPVVQEIGDILMNRFSGPSGLRLQEQCADFCKDQLVNLELLKNKRRQDAYLNHFIMNATQKEVCKKQDLKDRLPKVMQRLTKYPLLFDNLLKITPVGTEEHARLLRALKNIKMILDEINETVRDSENRRVLQDMQRRMDARHLENERHPILDEFKNIQLTEHKLRHYGPLTWNVSASKNIELTLALFQDFLIIFQSQDNRLVLKCETTGQDSAKFIFLPVLKPGNLLVKDAPRTTRKFYLINASKEASQMYTLTAKTKDVREEWMKQIREVTEEYKKKHSQPHSPSKQPPKPSVLTEVNPCYEVVEPEPTEASRRQDGEAASEKEHVDVTDGGKEEADDDELTNNEHSSVAYDPEKELKRQIIATHELMMDKIKALSELHHIESPNFDLSEKTLPLDTDSDTFITAMDSIIDGMTDFFTSLPDVLLPESVEENGSQEWDPVESLLELGERLEMLVRQLENLVLQRNAVPDVPPPIPTSEPPQLDEESGLPEHSPAYVESNF